MLLRLLRRTRRLRAIAVAVGTPTGRRRHVFARAELAVGVLVERAQRFRGVRDFVRGNFPVVIRVERRHERLNSYGRFTDTKAGK